MSAPEVGQVPGATHTREREAVVDIIEAWQPPTYKMLYSIMITNAPLLKYRGNQYQVQAVWIAWTWDYEDGEWIPFSQLLVRRKMGNQWSGESTLNLAHMKDQPKWVSSIIDRATPRSTH